MIKKGNGQTEQERITFFAKFGYDTLIIRENELKIPEQVIANVKRFS